MVNTLMHGVRGLFCGKPPLVVFLLCLGAFAIALMSAAWYLNASDVQDQDVNENWNTFMSNFADMQFCVDGNLTSVAKVRGTQGAMIPSVSTDLQHDRNYSVRLLLNIRPTVEFMKIQYNMTYLMGTVSGRALGLKGHYSNELNVTFSLPINWTSSHCRKGVCEPIQVVTCVYLHGPTEMFPKSSAPQTCHVVANDTQVEYHAMMSSHRDWKYSYPYCKNYPKVTVQYEMNPTLSVMLSLGDKSIINLHLMHTSYFLFVMIVTIICYALIRGRSNKNKAIQTDSKYGQTA